jgi:hypothetical protein
MIIHSREGQGSRHDEQRDVAANPQWHLHFLMLGDAGWVRLEEINASALKLSW